MVRYASIPICRRHLQCVHCGRRFASWPQIFQHSRASHQSIPNYAASLVALPNEHRQVASEVDPKLDLRLIEEEQHDVGLPVQLLHR